MEIMDNVYSVVKTMSIFYIRQRYGAHNCKKMFNLTSSTFTKQNLSAMRGMASLSSPSVSELYANRLLLFWVLI